MKAVGRGRILIGLTVITVATGACSSSGEESRTETGATAGSSDPSDRRGYVVAAGDAVSLIADRFCISGEQLAVTNGWSDGISHPIFPGDELVLPAEACVPTEGDTQQASPRPSASTRPAVDTAGTGGGEYLDLLDQGTFLDPFNGDGIGYWAWAEPECNDASQALYSFYTADDEAPELIARLEALSGAIPADALAQIERRAAFNDDHFSTYIERYAPQLAGDPRENAQLRAAMTEPVVVAMLDDSVRATVSAAYDYIGDVCTPLDVPAAEPSLTSP